jgi:hypothetical protein
VVATVLPTAALAHKVQPPPEKNRPYTSGGPRIAKIEMMSPEEFKEFNASYSPGKTSSP